MFVPLLIYLSFQILEAHDIKSFDDSVLYDINWPGKNFQESDWVDAENLVITTAYKEKYKCTLPNVQEKSSSVSDNYNGPSALKLISPLFSQGSCSYRLESYWAYEVCHGKHIRQYHEDREGKKVKLQEYFLGYFDKTLFALNDEENNKDEILPVKKIDGTSLPYYQITMGNGTRCELNEDKPRETKILYVCYVHGKHEVFSIKETSTCAYEIIILSPLLCSHPKYKPPETGDNQINCLPLDDNPNKPRNLMMMRNEAAKLRRKSDIDHIRVEFHPLDLSEKEETTKAPPPPLVDTSPVESFLAGKNCLHGGTGWWKYEFCYGKSVKQYHVEKDGGKATINLGRFDKLKHINWISQHRNKLPKPLEQRTYLTHLYSGGDMCDKTGIQRKTEVKLKCLKDSSNINAVSLYLLEPKYCEYILGVESPLICDILHRADEYGLVAGNNDDDGIIEDEISTINIVRV